MTIEFKLPEIADGVEDGEVSEVYVSVGDIVQKDDPVLELEVSKGQVPVPCGVSGKVVEVHVSEGDVVPIGAVLLTLEAVTASEPTTSSVVEASPPPAVESSTPPAAAAPPEPPTMTQPVLAPPTPSPAPPHVPSAPVATASSSAAPNGESVAAGPSIRRFAREVGVDLTTIRGTGPGGRIQREDVLQAVRTSGQPALPESDVSTVATKSADVETERKPEKKTAEKPKQKPDASKDKWGPIRVEKLSRIRRTIADRMVDSWTTAPRVTNFDDADITDLELIRQSSKADYAKKHLKLTTMPFVIKAVAMALKTNPTINASLDLQNNRVIYKEYVNVGIAVDTDRGLVVPSLRQPDAMSIQDLARELAEMATSVREGKFKLSDLAGSTFTISNLGAIGGTYSTPIINVPEVAILLVGRARKMPVVVDDEVVVRLMTPLSLSYDHRLVDGGAAARFLNTVIDLLQSPSRLLLAP